MQEGKLSIGDYWWGGLIYVLPGLIGLLAGCTRNVTLMVLYLIFNLVCCICSLVVVVVCALVLIVWVNIDEVLHTGTCQSSPMHSFAKSCTCSGDDVKFTLYGGNCEVFMSVQVIIGAMISLAAVSSLLSFIASYISCCSLCNQENTDVGSIIISGGAGVYQPPPVVVSNTAYPNQYGSSNQHVPTPDMQINHPPYNPQHVSYPPPPPYVQQDANPNFGPPGYVPYPAAPTSDTTHLINNEIR